MIIVLLFFVSCDKFPKFTRILNTGDVIENIEPPKLTNFPLHGTWKVTDILPMKEGAKKKSPIENIANCYISDDLFSFESLVSINPCYKSYRVPKDDFFINHYGGYGQNLSLSEETIDVFIVYDESNSLYQNIIKVDEQTICLPYQGSYYMLERQDAIVSQSIIDKSRALEMEESKSDVEASQALLLGMRRLASEPNKEDNFIYSTFLVLFNEFGERVRVYSLEGLYIPRKSGFQRLTNERITTDFTTDRLVLVRLGDEDAISAESSVLKTLTFVGRDHVALQNKNMLSINHELSLGIYRLDQIKSYTPIDVKEYAGKPGQEQFEEMISRARAEANTEQNQASDVFVPNSYELGISHSEGQWVFSGLVRFESEGAQKYKEYRVNLIPRIKILPVRGGYTWREIKGFSPFAVDAESSPDKGYLAIQMPKKMAFYHSESGGIAAKEDFRFEIDKTDKIIMAEWTSGDEMNYWIDSIVNEGAKRIEGK